MFSYRRVYILVILASLFQVGACFTVVSSPFATRSSSRMTPRRLAEEGRTSDESESNQEAQDDATPAIPPPRPQQQQPRKRMDPLIMSLTRDDTVGGGGNGQKQSLPLLGDVPLDGSALVLVPAIVLGLVGFVMSINIALNSQDAILASLNEYSDIVQQAAVAKTNVIYSNDECRGICSSQQTDLESLKVFMSKFSK